MPLTMNAFSPDHHDSMYCVALAVIWSRDILRRIAYFIRQKYITNASFGRECRLKSRAIAGTYYLPLMFAINVISVSIQISDAGDMRNKGYIHSREKRGTPFTHTK